MSNTVKILLTITEEDNEIVDGYASLETPFENILLNLSLDEIKKIFEEAKQEKPEVISIVAKYNDYNEPENYQIYILRIEAKFDDGLKREHKFSWKLNFNPNASYTIYTDSDFVYRIVKKCLESPYKKTNKTVLENYKERSASLLCC